MAKKTFIIHLDSLDVLDELGETQDEKYLEAGKLLYAIRDYHKGTEIKLEPVTRIAFSPFKNQFVREGKKYQETCERNRRNGAKGGRKPNKLTEAKEPKEAEETHSVNEIELQGEEEIKPQQKAPKKPKEKPINIPTYEEFSEYAESKSKDINKWKLKLKYDSWIENGWKDGHNKPIKAWKSKLLNTLPYLTNEQGNSNQKNAGSSNQRTAGTYSRSQAVDKAQAVPRKDN